jgi:hypothetical protein
LLTTADVLHQAYRTGHINLNEAIKTWTKMLSKKQKLPASSFSEYLSAIEKGGK